MPWNVRGLNFRRKRRLIRNILHRWKADVVSLQGTKLTGDITKLLKEFWGNNWINHVQFKANGTRGDFVIMWDTKGNGRFVIK